MYNESCNIFNFIMTLVITTGTAVVMRAGGAAEEVEEEAVGKQVNRKWREWSGKWQ